MREIVFTGLAVIALSACQATGSGTTGGNSSSSLSGPSDAHFSSYRDTNGRTTFVFDPSRTRYGLYNSSGHLVRTGFAGGGNNWCPDIKRPCRTTVGEFSIYRKGGQDCKSRSFPIHENGSRGGAPIPYCMFFNNGMAIHGAYEIPTANVSHGCIRVPEQDARLLSSGYLGVGSRVVVLPYERKPQVKPIRQQNNDNNPSLAL